MPILATPIVNAKMPVFRQCHKSQIHNFTHWARGILVNSSRYMPISMCSIILPKLLKGPHPAHIMYQTERCVVNVKTSSSQENIAVLPCPNYVTYHHLKVSALVATLSSPHSRPVQFQTPRTCYHLQLTMHYKLYKCMMAEYYCHIFGRTSIQRYCSLPNIYNCLINSNASSSWSISSLANFNKPTHG